MYKHNNYSISTYRFQDVRRKKRLETVESSMMGDTFLEKKDVASWVEFEEELIASGSSFFLKFGAPPGALADTLPALHWET